MDLSSQIQPKIASILEPFGFECYPFKVGWYNNQVQDVFQLPYPDDTLAFIIISTPSVFEKCFIPFIKSMPQPMSCIRDPIDQCIGQKVSQIRQEFPNEEIEIMYDYELNHNRRPRVLVQTAGHLAGAVYYYQRYDVTQQPWTPRQKICGVAIHPKYGGWFGLRSVVIFKDTLVPELQLPTPPDTVTGDQKKIDLLERFNYSWQDWTYRDIIDVEERYSELQKEYFSTLPKDRSKLIEKILSGEDICTTGTGLDQGHAIS